MPMSPIFRVWMFIAPSSEFKKTLEVPSEYSNGFRDLGFKKDAWSPSRTRLFENANVNYTYDRVP